MTQDVIHRIKDRQDNGFSKELEASYARWGGGTT